MATTTKISFEWRYIEAKDLKVGMTIAKLDGSKYVDGWVIDEITSRLGGLELTTLERDPETGETHTVEWFHRSSTVIMTGRTIIEEINV